MKLIKDFIEGKAKDGAKADKFHVVDNKLVFRNVITETVNVYNLDVSRAEKLLNAHKQGLISIVDKDGAVIDRLQQRIIRAKQNGENRIYGSDIQYRTLREEPLAVRLASGDVIGNSARLELLGRKVAFGREVRRWNNQEHEVQRKLAERAIMVPFSVFEQAGLDITTFQIVDQSGAETVKRKVPDGWDKNTDKQKFRTESVHFTGASLFTVSGKTYLFDIDRAEIKHGIFNPFLVEIPTKVNTVKEAYDALKPDEVKKAESKGIKVNRQGEWFFIPTSLSEKLLDEAAAKVRSASSWTSGKFYLRVGNNRPNTADHGVEVNGKFYVKGTISHTGREHKDQKLVGWHQAIPNTANNSFQITGDVD